MTDPALTPDAVSLIRNLAGQGMNINRIRGALRRQEGASLQSGAHSVIVITRQYCGRFVA